LSLLDPEEFDEEEFEKLDDREPEEFEEEELD
jgi:hypothetical protein